jgi:glucose/arabinose dehydrogenase
LFLTAPGGDNARLFVAEQGGLIKILDASTGAVRSTPYLDLTAVVSKATEQGLLGLAFDPGYGTNGAFYVYYTDPAGTITIARFFVSANPDIANPLSQTVLATVPHPGTTNHNGGMLVFGQDGCLYVGIGDGGGSGDPNNNAQNLGSRLGKILRIDPATGAACTSGTFNPFLIGGDPLVWSFGLRNPWRFSFDRLTGDLYIGDVGEDAREEIDVSPTPNPGRGLNYGWRLMEGFSCFIPSSGCNNGALTLPVLDYPHRGGACSVTGGYVYRGTAAPAIQGTYFYADFCAGIVRSFRYNNGTVIQQTEWPLLATPSVSSFGQDNRGELYIVSQNGSVFRIVPN